MRMRKLPYVLGLPMLAITGIYVFVYLYRWSWNRALIVGLFFVAVEIVLVAAMLTDRMRKIERTLERLAETKEPAPRDDGDRHFQPHDHFAWLREAGDGLGVFVPVLLGLGVVVSGIAWAVERAAIAVAHPLGWGPAERRLLALAEGPVASLPTGRGTAKRIVVLAVTAAIAVVGIDALGDLTQTRPDPVAVTGSTTTLRIQLTTKDPRPDAALKAARNVWGACEGRGSFNVSMSGPVALGGGRFDLVVRPSLGKYAERQLVGCIEDATLTYIQADVVEVRHAIPQGSARTPARATSVAARPISG